MLPRSDSACRTGDLLYRSWNDVIRSGNLALVGMACYVEVFIKHACALAIRVIKASFATP